ncbi:MAG: methyl-accepting chemotaxis protein [Ignavibacteriae bacterium]|nr:methyl-accepting chemotaxis protein [Ignavibacteriota bacterium]
MSVEELTNKSNTLLTISMWSVFGLLILSVIFIPFQISKYITSSLEIISSHLKELTNGSFVKRTTNIKQKDDFGTICWDLNDATDQMEALLKEMGTTIDYVTDKKYFRPTMSAGLHGTYSTTAERVDKALKTQSADLIKEKEYLESNTEKILGVMEQFANGDLTVNLVPEKTEDIIGRLFLGFNKAVKNITGIVNILNETIQSTTAASLDISASSEQMASNAQGQSTQTLDITSAIEQMTKTIISTTENSTDAETLAIEGGKVVNASVMGMEKVAGIVEDAAVKVTELGKNNEQIGGIIGVINDIADQTNLLALNAAIEAARAGEDGRGFAVVADEVRKLSQRTTQATKEISTVINHIQSDVDEVVLSINNGNKEVQTGKELSQKVENVMNSFIESINVVTDNINQVATASEEQSSAAEQVEQNIAIINNVSSESAIGLQQIANATTDLEQLIETLNGAIANFHTGENFQNFENEYSSEHNYQEQNEMVNS